MPITEDMGRYVDPRYFGLTATITRAVDNSLLTVNVIFENPTEPVRDHDGFEMTVTANATKAMAVTADLVNVSIDDKITIEGVDYTIKDKRRVIDGKISELDLSKF